MVDVDRRLERIEGLLTSLIIDSKVSARLVEQALQTATEALIEFKAKAQSTHTREFINEEAYRATFGQPEAPAYGPTPSSFKNGQISTPEEFSAEFTDEELDLELNQNQEV